MLYLFMSEKAVHILGAIAAPLLSALLLLFVSPKLPKDQGRDFAVDGKKSAGKVRGAGLLFILAFAVSALLFVPLSVEYGLYIVLILLAMLSGYLDDRSDKPWGEYKKGIIDLVISAGCAVTYCVFHAGDLSMSLFGMAFSVHPVVYGILGTVLVWMMINAVNCSDGIDGFSSVLASVSILSCCAVVVLGGKDPNWPVMTVALLLVLIPYLWFNAQPSTMMMGDAGSRAIGLFLAVALMKTGNMLLVIPLCLVVCLDGLLGIFKVSVIRFLKVKGFLSKIRTPLHDHCRKNLGWSNTQVIYRFALLQAVLSLITILIMA